MRQRNGTWKNFSTMALGNNLEVDKLIIDSLTGYKWFLGRKKEFEQLFMTGKFADCYDLLQEVKKQLGVSLWYY
jgi:hypothetical protein